MAILGKTILRIFFSLIVALFLGTVYSVIVEQAIGISAHTNFIVTWIFILSTFVICFNYSTIKNKLAEIQFFDPSFGEPKKWQKQLIYVVIFFSIAQGIYHLWQLVHALLGIR